MTVLSNGSILKAVHDGKLVIEPFDLDSLQPASYDMRLHWKLLVSPTRYEKGKTIDLRAETGGQYSIQPGRFVGVLTKERLEFPLDIAGRFGLKSQFTRHGLVAFGGIQIDPGFKGRLAISLFHAGPEPLALKLDTAMFTVEFHNLDAPSTTGYTGEFQGQDDFPPMQAEFILNANTVSLSEIAMVPMELAKLHFRVSQVESRLPLISAPSISEIARIQGVVPLANVISLEGVWPQEDDIDEFLSTLAKWREGK